MHSCNKGSSHYLLTGACALFSTRLRLSGIMTGSRRVFCFINGEDMENFAPGSKLLISFHVAFNSVIISDRKDWRNEAYSKQMPRKNESMCRFNIQEN